MSILIKGMEMPESCHLCVAGYGGCCFVAPPEADGVCPDDGRADFCPLIPVPDHGDLIDRDELSELLEKYWSEFALNASESKDYNLMYEGFGIRDAKLVADGLPIIISADKEGRE